MMTISWKLLIEAFDGTFEPISWRLSHDDAPQGESVFTPVSEHILGYWLELQDDAGKVLYRRFIHRLPLGLAANWEHWRTRQRSHARYWLQIPHLREAKRVALFEQYIPAPEAKTLTCRQHFCAALPAINQKSSAFIAAKPFKPQAFRHVALC